jgi:uncharacterized protein (TIGR00725 family)
MKKLQIAVIGYNSDKSNPLTNKIAYDVGRSIARADGVLICGGLGGVMENACKGAKAEGGVTVGIIPQEDFSCANEYCDIVIASGIGYARDFLVATSADAIVVVGGGVGTLVELCVGYMLKKTIVAIPESGGTAEIYGGKYLDERRRILILTAKDADSAIRMILKQVSKEGI